MSLSMIVTSIETEFTRFMCPECFVTFDIYNEDRTEAKKMWAHDCTVDTSEWDDTDEDA